MRAHFYLFLVPFCVLSAFGQTTSNDYEWTADHMHVGVRWQPFIGKPANNAYDATRPVLATDSSYVQMWVSWAAFEPQEANCDYKASPSRSFIDIENAVNACNARGVKVEFVFYHTPGWANVKGESGGWKPKDGFFPEFMTRIATHFKGRVHAYQLSHEANNESLMKRADMDFLIREILTGGAKAIRKVYDAEPATPVMISTSGCSPCHGCTVRKGLKGMGGEAANDFYDQLIASPELMKSIDALNLNVSDHLDGYGMMDGSYITSAWHNYELVRSKLDASPYASRSILSSESWISWDDGRSAVDVNRDGVKNEVDAYEKAVTLLGQVLHRGLNTANLPWCDNSSSWAMGLTKRVDYNGRMKKVRPDLLTPNNTGGPDIVTAKVALHGNDETFQVKDGSGDVFSIDDYINPGDPNHLHYYVWRWYAQIAGGSDEVIRHARAGEIGNDITVRLPGYTGAERYRMASYNRTKDTFTVLIYASGGCGKYLARMEIPSTIQTGRYYNNDDSRIDFRGEGFKNDDIYRVRVETKDISMADGSDVDVVVTERKPSKVFRNALKAEIPNMNRFTKIEFIRVAK